MVGNMPISINDKLIIFDCDGVLVDSEIIVTRNFVSLISELGYQLTVEESLKRFTGKTDKAVYDEIMIETELELTQELIDSIQNKIHHQLHNEVEAISGMEAMLEIACLDKRTSICIASSGNMDKIHKSLSATNLIKYFDPDAIFSAQAVRNGKPAPDLFLYAAEKMGYDASDCIVIEDSEPGIQAAQAAGMQVIGFLGGSHAVYPWYERMITSHNIPVVKNTDSLRNLLNVF